MNGATVKSVKAGDLANYNDGNFGVFANEITTSWNGASKLNANVMSITFVANKSAKLSEVLTVGNSLTPAVANDIAGNEMNVNLKFTTGKVVGGEFALYQNTPNPVALETTIGFNLPKDESARLTVYSVDGKTILAKQIDGKAGVNQITINKSELNANGVMYYRLETAAHTATKKMVIIE
jgi:Secretion system C-terminal sorting domain